MVGAQAKQYLEKCGLDAQDIPKVLGAFLAAKYATAGASVALCTMYRPLSKLFVRRPTTIAFASKLRSQANEQALLRRALDVARGRYKDAKAVAKVRYKDAKAKAVDAKDRWEAAGRARSPPVVNRQLAHQRARAHRREHEEEARLRGAWGGWYSWTSQHYWRLSDKLQDSARRSTLWPALVRRIGGDPANVALGVAEGLILYKLTYLIHAPLELFLIVQAFRQRHLKDHDGADAVSVKRQIENGAAQTERVGLLEQYAQALRGMFTRNTWPHVE